MIDLPQADNCNSDECYEIEAVISFDERGQLVFPKDVRKKFDLKAGEKFVMVSCTNEQGLCCFTMVKTEAINKLIGSSIGSMVNNIGRKKK